MMPNSRIFRSRWSAVFWAAGIVFFAWQVAGSGPSSTKPGTTTDATGATVDDGDTQNAINALGSIGS
jgi:hypothetical protein